MLPLFLLGSLVDKVEELIEFGGDDDLGAAVALTARFGVVVGNRVVFAAAACRESCGVDSEIILKRLHHRRCAQSGEVPVIAYVGARDGDIVGIAFHEHIVVVVILDDLGDLAQRHSFRS